MSDLIEKDAAIHAIMGQPPEPHYPSWYAEQIKALPPTQTEPHWILCSERLPRVREWVLCQCRAGIMDVLRLTEDGDWNKNYPNVEYMSGFVIAWLPLPKPYKGGAENE